MRHRSLLVFASGFAILIALTAITGLISTRQTASAVTELVAVQQSETAFNQALDELQSGVYLEGILVRDFVLERSPTEANVLRRQLEALREDLNQRVNQLTTPAGAPDSAALQHLKGSLISYNDSLASILQLTTADRSSDGPRLLLRQSAETRKAVFSIANEIRELTQKDMRASRTRILESAEDTESFVRRLWSATVALSLTVAATALLWISRLERHAERHRKQIEQNREELRNLSNTLVRVQEEERKLLSRELHDQVGQMLTALRMEVRAMAELRGSSVQEFDCHTGEALSLTEQTLQTVRDMAMGLRPSILDDLGLGPAIEWLARDFSRRSGVAAAVQIDGELQNLPDSQRTCMFRIAQEALTNVLRHARAKKVRLSLHGSPGRLILTVQDDGTGIDQQRVHRGLGLVGMEERAKELRGSVSIISQPARGTLLQVELPLN